MTQYQNRSSSSGQLQKPSSGESSLSVIFSLVFVGAIAGAAATFRIANLLSRRNGARHDDDENSTCFPRCCSCDPAIQRERLPLLVILVRHGESEGNIDKTMWGKKSDHDIELTKKGKEQARIAGKRIEEIFRAYDESYGDQESINNQWKDIGKTNDYSPKDSPTQRRVIRNIHLHVSPFVRTRQTAKYARPFFDHRVTTYKLCPRLREQEFGNLQGEAFASYRQEQKRVGRFWYRFPTGESGADVLDRVKSWWIHTMLTTNNTYHLDNEDNKHACDAVVVFTHGLTLRSILCQLFKWSIFTFHSVYNAKNCDLYVLRKDLSKRGHSPYVLDDIYGNLPQSSIDVCVTFSPKSRKRTDEFLREKVYKLKDYLSIPSPRMRHIEEIKHKLVEQYPEDFDGGSDDIESISFLPFSVLAKLSSNMPSRESVATLCTSWQ